MPSEQTNLPMQEEKNCEMSEAKNWAVQTMGLWPGATYSKEYSAALVEMLCEYKVSVVRTVMTAANLRNKFQFLPSLKEINDLLDEHIDRIYERALHKRQEEEQLRERRGEAILKLSSRVRVLCESVRTLDPDQVAIVPCAGLEGHVAFISKAGDFMVALETCLLPGRNKFWFKSYELQCLDDPTRFMDATPEEKKRVQAIRDYTIAEIKRLDTENRKPYFDRRTPQQLKEDLLKSNPHMTAEQLDAIPDRDAPSTFKKLGG